MDENLVAQAFVDREDLRGAIRKAALSTPQYAGLFNAIAQHVVALKAEQYASQTIEVRDAGPVAKKRRLEDGPTSNGAVKHTDDDPSSVVVRDVSFTVPQRKKLTLEISSSAGGGIRARNPASENVEFSVALKDLQHVVCLPVPEKAQRQYTFCVFPSHSEGVTPVSAGATAADVIVWTVNDTAPQTASVGGKSAADGADEGETYRTFIRKQLNSALSLVGKKVIEPDERQFASALVEAHRKDSKAFHVKAFRGSKDGYLFFLSTGIVWGFKKPLHFFAFENIDSISYTSVLQRTFNLNITTQGADSDEQQEFEFSMLDQADYQGIDEYIRMHNLQDASLAEQRRAKKLNINGVKGAAAAGADEDAEEEEGELAKAERELQDAEDEEEEDYDPGSEGDSEGSGSDSEEDEEDGEGEEGEEDFDDDEEE